jgi:hypothetical protein
MELKNQAVNEINLPKKKCQICSKSGIFHYLNLISYCKDHFTELVVKKTAVIV